MEKKDMIDVLVIHVPLHSDSINVPESHTVFVEENGKKKISISHFLEGN